MSLRRKQALRHGNMGFSAGAILTLVLFLIAAGGVAWVYAGMVAQERWPIKWLEVDGPFERVGAEQIRAVITPLVTGSYFTVDTEQMQELGEDMPWVAVAKVEKHWPDTVQVTIEEFTPVAHWIEGQLISADGSTFTVPNADDMQGLPWLYSPETQLEVVFANWKKFDDRLQQIGQQVERLSVDARGSWSAQLSGGTEVRFGKGDVFKNLDMLINTWAMLMEDQELPPVSVDLRYTNGLAVLWPKNLDAVVGTYGEKS